MKDKIRDFLMDMLHSMGMEVAKEIVIQRLYKTVYKTEEEARKAVDEMSVEEYKSLLKAFIPEIPDTFLNNERPRDIEEDYTPKKVGDAVVAIDMATMMYFHYYDTKEACAYNKHLNSDVKPLEKEKAIVVETGVDFTYKCGHCSQDHTADLVIYYPCNKKKYYCHSKDLKLVEDETKN